MSLILFPSQSKRIVHQIVSIFRVAAPFVVYFAIVLLLQYGQREKLGFWGEIDVHTELRRCK
jgi:arsenite transporter